MRKFSQRAPIAPKAGVAFIVVLGFLVVIGAVLTERIFRPGKSVAGEVPAERSDIHGDPSDSTLSGKVRSNLPVKTPDEIAIRIGDDGQVYLNDDPLDTRAPGALPELTANLTQLKASSDASRSEVLVTIYAENKKEYQRVIDVLDSLGQARIASVTFQPGAGE